MGVIHYSARNRRDGLDAWVNEVFQIPVFIRQKNLY
jgi:hypothetical protein